MIQVFHMRLAGMVIVAAIGIDQAIKQALIAFMDGEIVLTSFFSIMMVRNHGVSFGLLTGHTEQARWLLIVMALTITAGLGWWLTKQHRLLPVLGLAMAIGGALGNVVDRLFRGSVVDYLYLHLQNWSWPAFNFADTCITLGVVLIVLDGLFVPDPPRNTVRNV
ncbi:MAG: signal peptidase II [Pseudomonadota bacterium]|nr:signal peptidase II [Pseudomonadota bacterium]